MALTQKTRETLQDRYEREALDYLHRHPREP